MKKKLATFFMLMAVISLPAQKKADRIEEFYLPKFKTENVTPFKAIGNRVSNSLNFNESDIQFRIIRSDNTSQGVTRSLKYTNGKYSGHVIRDNSGSVTDTIVTHMYVHDGIRSYDKVKLAKYISMNEYVADKLREQQEYIDSETKRIATALANSQQLENKYLAEQRERERAKFVSDSLNLIEKKQIALANEQAERQYEIDKYKNRADRMKTNFYEPTSEIKTKTFKSKLGADITYSYYIKDGEEIYHGKYTATHIYRNYKFWGGGNYGFIYLNGTETYECTYRNGVMHGQYKYARDVKQESTWNNEHDLKHSIIVNIWNGFLDGKFHFIADDFVYDGLAKNGILEKITVTKSSNSHSINFASNMNGDRTKPYILSFNDEFSSAFYDMEITYFSLTVPKQPIPMPYVIQ